MNISFAKALVADQNARIKTLHGKRFVFNGYEYELRYEGGISSFVALFRRQVGKRNFKYFSGDGCYDCLGAATALEKVCAKIPGFELG